jgi:predicted nucleic acid-binding protein
LVQYFFDTSALVKYYHKEPGTALVSAIFAEPSRKIRISSLGLLEAQSAFAQKVRAGVITLQDAGLQRAHLMLDIAASAIEVYSVAEDHYTTAARLIGQYSPSSRLRALDALQLAVALDLSSQGLLDTFVVADHPLAEIATREGLKVIEPSGP